MTDNVEAPVQPGASSADPVGTLKWAQITGPMPLSSPFIDEIVKESERKLQHGCSRCSVRWNGKKTAHCSGIRSEVFSLLALRDSDTRFFTQSYPHLYECPIDSGRIAEKPFSNLLSAQPSRIEHGSLFVPRFNDDFFSVRGFRPGAQDSIAMYRCMFDSGKWSKIFWTVVGLVSVDVVNVLFSGDPAVTNAVLVGFDVRIGTDLPAKANVAVSGDIATSGDIVRYQFASRKLANPSRVSRPLTRSTKTLLRSAADFDSTHGAGFNHELSLQVNALCHELFSGPSAFDQHRVGGLCVPADEAVMLRHGLARQERAGYVVWGYAGSDERWGNEDGDEDE